MGFNYDYELIIGIMYFIFISCRSMSHSEALMFSFRSEKNLEAIISSSVVVTVVIIAATAIAALYLRKQLKLTQERKLLIQARMTGVEVPELEVCHVIDLYVYRVISYLTV